MKRVLLFACIVASLYFTVSCTKSNPVTTTIRDTTVVKDTTVLKDTILIKSKDTVYITNSKNPIVGVWVGSYFVNGDAVDSFLYQLDIRSDSTVWTIGSGTNQTAGYASGPWHLSGTTFTASLTTMAGVTPENTQTISATYDSVSGRLYNGVWIDTRGNNGQTGTFSVKRVQ